MSKPKVLIVGAGSTGLALAVSLSNQIRRNAFRFLSQIHIGDRDSRLSDGHAGSVAAGYRLPWIDYGDDKDNFGVLDGTDWQLHLYGDAAAELDDLAWIPVHRFPSDEHLHDAGWMENAVHLIRPDGYIGQVLGTPDAEMIQQYLGISRRHGPCLSPLGASILPASWRFSVSALMVRPGPAGEEPSG